MAWKNPFLSLIKNLRPTSEVTRAAFEDEHEHPDVEITEEEKANPTYQMVVDAIGNNRPEYSPRNYKTAADVAYAQNIYIFRAINMIAQACAGIPWKLYSKSSDEEIIEHPILEFLTNPNGEKSWPEVVEEIIAYWLIAGNSYVKYVFASKRGMPIEMWPLPPDRFAIAVDKNGIKQYTYTVHGISQVFPANEVMHLKMFNASDDLFGLSPVLVAASIVDQMNEGNNWNTAMLQNSARPSGALMMAGTLSDDQFRRLRRQMTEKYSGKRNAGRPLLLEGGLQWQQFSLSPSEMNWLTGKQENAKEIAICMGIPPEMMGTTQNRTYSNYAEARKSFYTETVLPMMDRLQGHFNLFLVPLFGQGIELRYDKEDVEALHDDKDVITKRAVDLFNASLITWNEARELIGQTTLVQGEFLNFPVLKRVIALESLEDFLEQNAYLPVGTAVSVTDSVTGASPAELNPGVEGNDDASSTNLQTSSSDSGDAGRSSTSKSRTQISRNTSYGRTRNDGRSYAAISQQKHYWTTRLHDRVLEYQKNQRSEIIEALSGAAFPSGTPERLTFALKRQTDALSALVVSSLLVVTDDIGTSTSPLFDIWSSQLQSRLAEKASLKASLYLKETKRELELVVTSAVERGKTVEEIVTAVAQFYDEKYIYKKVAAITADLVTTAANLGTPLPSVPVTVKEIHPPLLPPSSDVARVAHAVQDLERKLDQILQLQQHTIYTPVTVTPIVESDVSLAEQRKQFLTHTLND